MGLRAEVRLLRHGRDWRGRSTVPRSAEPWLPAAEPREFPTDWARSTPAMVARNVLRRGVLRPVTWSQVKPQVEGTEYLQHVAGPVVFVANHSSHLDAPLILGSLPRRFADRTATGAAADYFFDVRWRAATTALFFNAFPVQRHGERRVRHLAVELLRDGWSLLLFPEGTRSEDGWMNSFKLGTAQLCVSNGIPVVPISLRGAYAAMPRGRNWPKPGRPRVVVRYGRPLYPEPGEGVREFRTRMTRAVVRLGAEEDLGWYRAMRADADGALLLPGVPKSALPAAAQDEVKPDEAARDVADEELFEDEEAEPGLFGADGPAATLPAVPPGVALRNARDVAGWRRVWESTRPMAERRRRVWR